MNYLWCSFGMFVSFINGMNLILYFWEGYTINLVSGIIGIIAIIMTFIIGVKE